MDFGMFVRSEYYKTVAEVVAPAGDLVLACGVSVGYANPSYRGRACRALGWPLL
jgi:hypothetical protein